MDGVAESHSAALLPTANIRQSQSQCSEWWDWYGLKGGRAGSYHPILHHAHSQQQRLTVNLQTSQRWLCASNVQAGEHSPNPGFRCGGLPNKPHQGLPKPNQPRIHQVHGHSGQVQSVLNLHPAILRQVGLEHGRIYHSLQHHPARHGESWQYFLLVG